MSDNYTCTNCGKKHGANNFPMYRCHNCNTVFCSSCKKNSGICQVCKKETPTKVR